MSLPGKELSGDGPFPSQRTIFFMEVKNRSSGLALGPGRPVKECYVISG